jgi:hypothetical protein
MWIVAVNTLACFVISYALGFRNLHLVYAALLAWWPLLYLFVNVGWHIVPPKVEIATPAKSTSEILRNAKRNIAEIWRDEPLGLNLSDKKRRK